MTLTFEGPSGKEAQVTCLPILSSLYIEIAMDGSPGDASEEPVT